MSGHAVPRLNSFAQNRDYCKRFRGSPAGLLARAPMNELFAAAGFTGEPELRKIHAWVSKLLANIPRVVVARQSLPDLTPIGELTREHLIREDDVQHG
jgi:hypothetical protein